MWSTINKLCFIVFISTVFYCPKNSLLAQLGAHGGNIQWQQINTSTHQIIFPEGFQQQANRVANIMDYMDAHNTRSIGIKKHPLKLLIHNQTTVPNGFVGIGPYRSEFFATPPQSANFLGTVDWLDALAIHEYRHAQQYSNSRVGLSKFAHYLMGENGWGLATSLIPNWFWEGDAVVTETALSNQGRGRSPFFSRGQRALLANDRTYSYQKARNGSYKDLLPSRYPLGYVMTTHARKKFGNDIWKDIFENAARYRPIIYSFSKALKKQTGLSTTQLYKEAYQKAQNRWTTHQKNATQNIAKRIKVPPTKTVSFYRFPYYLKDGSLVYLKNSFKETAALYQLKNGQEQQLTTIGFTLERYLSVNNNRAVWVEYERDPRRAKRNYSTIVSYNFQTHEKKRLTKKSRLFSPSFANQSDKLVAVRITPTQQNNLVLINPSTGTIEQVIPNPDNQFISFPKWLADDSGLVFIGKQQSQLAIFKYSFENENIEQLTAWTHHTISDLFVQQEKVYFTASFSGIDNIYSIPLTANRASQNRNTSSFSSNLQQWSEVRIGAYFPSVHPDNQQIVFSEFDDKGYYLSQLSISSSINNSANTTTIIEPFEQEQYLINSMPEEGGNILNKLPTSTYAITPYKGLFNGMKLHSWNLAPSISVPTLDIQAANILQDFSINLLGGYNLNEKTPFYVASATYGKWYPQIRVFASLADRSTTFQSTADTLARQTYDQQSIGTTVSLPLTWNKGNFGSRLQPWVSFAHRFIRNSVIEQQEQDNFSFSTIGMGINLSHLRRTAYQNVDTRWGQSLFVSYFQTANKAKEGRFKLEGNLYLPGIGANHSIKLEIDHQQQDLTDDYQFSDSFDYPRGYGKPQNNAFTKLAVNYHFPIAYPDWGFWGITYFKRIRANIFYDHGKASSPFLKDNLFQSLGVEVLLDNNFFMELPVTIGLRNSFLLRAEEKRRYVFEFFVSSEFF